MANFAKSLKKSTENFQNKLFSDNGLTLRQTFKSTTSLYKGKNESKPLISLTSRGDYKISVLRLVIILLCAVSCAAVVVLLIQRAVDRCRTKKQHKSDIFFAEPYADENEIPF